MSQCVFKRDSSPLCHSTNSNQASRGPPNHRSARKASRSGEHTGPYQNAHRLLSADPKYSVLFLSSLATSSNPEPGGSVRRDACHFWAGVGGRGARSLRFLLPQAQGTDED